jgi:hypothetical protein
MENKRIAEVRMPSDSSRYHLFYVVMWMENIRRCETMKEASMYIEMYKDNDRLINLYLYDTEKKEITWRNPYFKSDRSEEEIIKIITSK